MEVYRHEHGEVWIDGLIPDYCESSSDLFQTMKLLLYHSSLLEISKDKFDDLDLSPFSFHVYQDDDL